MREPTRDALIAEYGSAYAAVLHYDSFRWSAGSMLIAGVFLFWGVLFTNGSAERLFAPASIVVALVMGVWLLYANHYRQLYLWKLKRIHEIERALGMKANVGFIRTNPEEALYRPVGLRGHQLDSVLFVLISVSGPFLAYFRTGWRWWQLLPVAVAAVVVGVVAVQEAVLQRRLAVRSLP